MRFLSINGRLARITDHGSENFVTSEGIAVGDSAADVRVAYPDAIEEPAKDDGPPAHTLTSWATPAERGIRFYISAEGVVAGITAGNEAIGLSEGCS